MSRQQSGPEVVVVGSINVDLVLTVARHPAPGETLLGGGGHSTPGGKGANQAVAAALRGARTAMVGAVGDDAAAAVGLSLLDAAGVDLTRVARVPGPTGLAVVTLSETGENTIVVVPGANDAVDAALVESAADPVAAAAVLVLQGEVPLGASLAAARIADAAGRRIVLNAAPAAAVPEELLRLADPLVVNEHEAAIVLAGALGDDAVDPPATPEEATVLARRLRDAGARSVVVTLGGAGVVVAGPDGAWHLAARPVVAVDTVGAGDAFVGALAAGLASGAGMADAAREAVAVAAYAVAHEGAQASYPGLDDQLP
ncbi:MAG: ribokinase [Micrococcales bacterium 73-15]|uniref:PfkB family carbohydrate kinase n=1 Tax=Salana multivorans TaxID=120377 RepID=UPI0009676072|nr:PfkB family carbohydrate kinase [Salana multivorans]OJX97451.1 MAG: ribokinase [Micrococcales bacterium 73-15]